jgi:hypothetical protein
MSYIENPKTAGSGILCAIPQKGTCPVGCSGCFFQGGRSYLEPLDKNLPNMPPLASDLIVRCNDGNDSNVDRELVVESMKPYRHVFYNTSIPKDLEGFSRPVVLTVNPAGMTDSRAHLLDPIPSNLMFVRVRTNLWNLDLVDTVVEHYDSRNVPVVLTFMAYYDEKEVDKSCRSSYEWKTRTLNPYWVLRREGWERVVDRYNERPLVYTCGKDHKTYSCARCGNCLREYYATLCRMG